MICLKLLTLGLWIYGECLNRFGHQSSSNPGKHAIRTLGCHDLSGYLSGGLGDNRTGFFRGSRLGMSS
jgi:hypothetical protein